VACTSATRTMGIFAHVDAGKTTTSEAFLYLTGRIHRVGRVDQGDTQLDWMEQERKRGSPSPRPPLPAIGVAIRST